MKTISDRVAIVCPVYKTEWTKFEEISFKRVLTVMSSYDIYLCCPEGLKAEGLCDKYELKGCAEYFDKRFFKNVNSYSSLLMDSTFYERWRDNYDYILIYQLDCYVFHSDLSRWINEQYDYVGAPWFEGYTNDNESNKIIGVGNGGLSLRKLETFFDISKNFSWSDLLRQSSVFGITRSYYKYLKHRIFKWRLNEDLFWGDIAPRMYDYYKLTSLEDSIAFSFERNPSMLFKKNNNQLPFGCHAFERYDIDFWREHIPQLNN